MHAQRECTTMTTSNSVLPKPAGLRSIGTQRCNDRQRIDRLLARYPDVSESEGAEILRFVRAARYVEIARLTSDESLSPQLDHFIRNHRHQLHWSSSDWLMPIVLLIALFAACWLLWG